MTLHNDDFHKQEELHGDDAKDVHSHERHGYERRGSHALPPWPTSKHPTPYEIFNLARGSPYKKTRFHELVKLYHPDRHHHLAGGHGHGHAHMHATHSLSTATILERYRLVVAANEILSNPARRRAYDLYGAGWAGRSDMRSAYRDMDQSWRARAGSAANNATWEDWERWHRARDGNGNSRGEKQEPQFMSNGGFAAVVLVFIMLGGFLQTSRVGSTSMTLLEMRELQDERINRRIQAAQAPLSRKDRVFSFLERREGWYDIPFSASLVSARRPNSSQDGK